MSQCAFSIGGSERERIEVIVLGYERPPSGEYYDDNWLNVQVCVSAGGFTGRFGASFQTAELIDFRNQLSSLYDTLKGEANFETMETQLALVVKGDGRGGMSLKGVASDQSGIGNCLEFNFDLDQTHVGKALRELNQVVEQFPVRAG
jgi:hypothetical protein